MDQANKLIAGLVLAAQLAASPAIAQQTQQVQGLANAVLAGTVVPSSPEAEAYVLKRFPGANDEKKSELVHAYLKGAEYRNLFTLKVINPGGFDGVVMRKVDPNYTHNVDDLGQLVIAFIAGFDGKNPVKRSEE